MELSVCVESIKSAVVDEISCHFPKGIIDFVDFDYDAKSKETGYISGVLQIHLIDEFVVGPEYRDSYIVYPIGVYKSSIPFSEAVSELRQEIAKYMKVVERKGYLLSKEVKGKDQILSKVNEALSFASNMYGCSVDSLSFTFQVQNLIRVFQYDYYKNYGEFLDDLESYVKENGRLPEGNTHLYFLYSYLSTMQECLSFEERERFSSIKFQVTQKHITELLDAIENFCTEHKRWYNKGEGGSTLFWMYNYINLGKVSDKQLTKFNDLYARYAPTFSEAEHTVVSYLNHEGYVVKVQYEFEDCRHVVPLPFDIAFWVAGKLCLVECNGLQHYKPVDCFGGKSGFEARQRNDEIKRSYCKENNIPLLEIPYTVDAEGIPSELEIFIEKVKKGKY